jgi:hypothetical protein
MHIEFLEVPIWEYSNKLWVQLIVPGLFLPRSNKCQQQRDTQNRKEYVCVRGVPFLSNPIPLHSAKGVSSYERM